MFGLIKKTILMLGVLAVNAINPFPIFDRITYTSTQTSTPTSTSTSTLTTTYTSYENLPIVVLHGLESSSQEMVPFCEWLGDTFNATVYNMEIGDGKKTSMYTSLNDQLDELCNSIYNIDHLSAGFHFIGISQGGLLARGYVEQCNLYPVKNLITLVAPHGGIYFKHAKNSRSMYNDFFQNNLAIAGYWRNPTMLDDYLTSCSFLPALNNEFWCDIESPIYRNNIRNLSNFIMIWSPMDLVLHPAESGKFSFYDADLNVLPLEKTDLYQNDDLGLKYLDNRGRLHMYETNCSHVDHRNPVCFAQLYDILQCFL